MATGYGLRNYLIVVADLEAFGERYRTFPAQRAARDGLYDVMEKAFAVTGTAWRNWHWGDRGDGMVVLIPGEVDKAAFIEALLPVLVTRLRAHNTPRSKAERIRLRIALHTGEVAGDKRGYSSTALNLAFRLCDASPLKAMLAASPGDLAVIASDRLYDDVVSQTPGTAPETWYPVPVKVKETAGTGYIARPDHPFPARTCWWPLHL